MGARRNFCRGGKPKKTSHLEKKIFTIFHEERRPTLAPLRAPIVMWILQTRDTRGLARIWQEGAKNYFFFRFEICMSRSDMLRFARGFGGMLTENFF